MNFLKKFLIKINEIDEFNLEFIKLINEKNFQEIEKILIEQQNKINPIIFKNKYLYLFPNYENNEIYYYFQKEYVDDYGKTNKVYENKKEIKNNHIIFAYNDENINKYDDKFHELVKNNFDKYKNLTTDELKSIYFDKYTIK